MHLRCKLEFLKIKWVSNLPFWLKLGRDATWDHFVLKEPMALISVPSLKEYKINANTYIRRFPIQSQNFQLARLGKKHNTNGNFIAQHSVWIWFGGGDRYGCWYQTALCEKMAAKTSSSHLWFVLVNKHGQKLGFKRQ